MLDSPRNHKRLIPVIWLPSGIFLRREVRDRRGYTVRRHNLEVALPITVAETLGLIEGGRFGCGNREKNSANAVCRISRGFDVAFARTVGAFLIESQAVAFNEGCALGSCRWRTRFQAPGEHV